MVASPCALAASMMPTLLSALSSGARNGVLFKGSTFIEALGRINAVAFDKTGTLTQGHPSVDQVITVAGEEVATILAKAAAVESMSEHPIGTAIVAEARRRALSIDTPTEFQSVIGVGAHAVVDGQRWQVGKPGLFATVPEELAAAQMRLEADGRTVVIVGEERARGLIALRDTLRPNARETVRAYVAWESSTSLSSLEIARRRRKLSRRL